MVLDCERLNWDVHTIVGGLDSGRYTYSELMFELCILPDEQIADRVPPEGNHLEHYDSGITKLLHYTVVLLQPWRSDDNPLGWLWEQAYRDAVRAGAVPWDEVEELVRSGEVKPSLADAFEDVSVPAGTPDDVVAMELQAVRA